MFYSILSFYIVSLLKHRTVRVNAVHPIIASYSSTHVNRWLDGSIKNSRQNRIWCILHESISTLHVHFRVLPDELQG